MKQSRFNLFFENDEKIKIAFNSMSCALAEVDDKFFNILNNLKHMKFDALNHEEAELVQEMKDGRFIIDDEFDEVKNLEFSFNSAKFKEKNLSITIAPTLQCNFKCIYCYENPKHGKMDIKIQDMIIEKIKKSAEQKKNIDTCWYGGEPLLAFDIISYMSEKIINICKENGVSYASGMVSNGYLLNEEIMEKLVEYNIKYIQLTIDGPQDVHDKRRILKGNGNGTFEKIIENLIKLKKYDITATVRINIDKSNMNSAEELIKILKDNDLTSVPVSLGHVMDFTEACKSISEDCLEGKEFSGICLGLSKKFIENGFKVIGRKMYPTVINKFCGANCISNFVIDPSGYAYKCWNDIGYIERSIGNLGELNKQDDKMNMNNIKYMTWSPFDYKDCTECNLLPICMGGCSFLGMKLKKPFCTDWKYQIEQYLNQAYFKMKDGVKEGSPVYEKTCI